MPYFAAMDLRKRLDDDLKDAMRAKDTLRLETVRNVRSSMRAREIDSGKDLDDAELQKLIRGLVKQREDSITQYREGGRADLVERESAEKLILEGYLPAAISAESVDALVSTVIAELSASTMKDMGRVVKTVMERLGPAGDGRVVSAAVKGKLGV